MLSIEDFYDDDYDISHVAWFLTITTGFAHICYGVSNVISRGPLYQHCGCLRLPLSLFMLKINDFYAQTWECAHQWLTCIFFACIVKKGIP
jgi:hypothetical protein